MADYIDNGKIPLPKFVPIFTGVGEHLLQGRMSIIDFGVYTLLQLRCNWTTGIYYGCSQTLAACMGGQLDQKQVRKSFIRLRKSGYINYKFGNGSRGSYNILINRFISRAGGLEGFRLNAFAENSLEQPLYESRNSQGTVEGRSRDGGGTVEEQSRNGWETVTGTPQEINNKFKNIRILEFKNNKNNTITDLSAFPDEATEQVIQVISASDPDSGFRVEELGSPYYPAPLPSKAREGSPSCAPPLTTRNGVQ